MASTPTVVGEHVYVGSCAGRFEQIDRARGTILASHDVQEDSVRRQFHGDAAVAGELLLIATDAAPGDSAWVLAFDRGTVRLRWRLRLGSGSRGDIAISNGRGYAVTLQDELVCFDAASGSRQWTFAPRSSSGNWITGSPLIVEGKAVFSDLDGTVHALDAATGRETWRRPLQGVSTWLALAAGELWLVRGEATLVALDPGTGVERSRTVIPGGPYAGPIAAAGDSSLLLLGERAITCVDLDSRTVRWTRAEASGWSSARPYVWRGTVLAGSESGRLVALDLADGRARWEHEVPGAIRGVGACGDTLYVGTISGRVHALAWMGTGP